MCGLILQQCSIYMITADARPHRNMVAREYNLVHAGMLLFLLSSGLGHNCLGALCSFPFPLPDLHQLSSLLLAGPAPASSY